METNIKIVHEGMPAIYIIEQLDPYSLNDWYEITGELRWYNILKAHTHKQTPTKSIEKISENRRSFTEQPVNPASPSNIQHTLEHCRRATTTTNKDRRLPESQHFAHNHSVD